MTAGSGVVHEEFQSSHFADEGGQFEMLQLWVNLPAKHKWVSPKYQSMNVERFPVVATHEGKSRVKVIAGEFSGAKGSADTFTKMNVYEVKANAAHSFSVETPVELERASGEQMMTLQQVCLRGIFHINNRK